MNSDEYIQNLIADYLEFNGLNNTLSAFQNELNKTFDSSSLDESLTTIIKDRINFKRLAMNKSNGDINNEKLNQSALIRARNLNIPKWTVNFPKKCEVLNLGTLNSLIINSNFFKADVHGSLYNIGLFITNTKILIVFDIDKNEILLTVFNPLNNNQLIKFITGIDNTNFLILCDMNGNLNTFIIELESPGDGENENDKELKLIGIPSKNPVKLHKRLITDFKVLPVNYPNSEKLLGYFSSIGWDSKLIIGKIVLIDGSVDLHVIDEYKLFNNATSLLLTIDHLTLLPIMLVGTLDSSLLSLLTVTNNGESLIEITKISLNDSQFSSDSFQPMSIIQNSSKESTENSIITIGTNHIPYMRLISILLLSLDEILSDKINFPFLQDVKSTTEKLSKLFHYKNNLNLKNHANVPILRSLIISNFNSLSPQDKYSSPILLSRKNLNGIWIPGDDGKLRGFDLNLGSIIETLSSNDGRVKTAFIGDCDSGEVIVTCGALDKKIVIWK